ncbi:MAG: PEP-CTERM sorting domain-containing protein [Acidobacteria bacterium]|nr:PEP-CTERM sorting domain-containing protein [Acidobacteriota bacterium]
MNKLKKLLRTTLFFIAVFIATQVTIVGQTIELDYDFRRGGTLGWTADFADYPPNIGTGYELDARLRFMPRKLTRVPKRGFYIQGHNRSADLFMFLKRRLTTADGIVAGQTYRIEYVIKLASNAPSRCVGIGGAPGESVFLKAGASSIEPLAVLQPNGYLRMYVDKGNQAQSGAAASVAGNIANGIPCEQAFPYYPFALIQRSHQHTTDVMATSNGELWLLVGTDSGFEGLTRLYYQSIRVKLIPL